MVCWHKATQMVSNTNQGSPEVKKTETIVWTPMPSKHVPENGFCHFVLRSPPAHMHEYKRISKHRENDWGMGVRGKPSYKHLGRESMCFSKKNGWFSISQLFFRALRAHWWYCTNWRKLTSFACVVSHARQPDCRVVGPEEMRSVSKHSLIWGTCSS